MKLKNKIKIGIGILGLGFILNYSPTPLLYLATNKLIQTVNTEKEEIVKTTNTDKILGQLDFKDTKEKDLALTYLKTAHAITSKFLEVKEIPFSTQRKANLAKEGEADCLFFSIYTFTNFRHIAEKENRPDLLKNVRVAYGIKDDGKNKGPHAWLQVKQGDSWSNYETANNLIDGSDRTMNPMSYLINIEQLDPQWEIKEAILENDNSLTSKNDPRFKPLGYVQHSDGKLEKKINLRNWVVNPLTISDIYQELTRR